MILRAENINKTIGKKSILCDVSVSMESGKIYGICGRNGCGKTMLLRALSGLMMIDSGKIFLDQKELHKDFMVLPNLGITIENAGMFPSMTGFENLKYLSNIQNKIENKKIEEAIARVGLNPKDRRQYRKYSMGMRQRIAIAQAIMEDPQILFLDEPTNGLDESGVELIRSLLKEEREKGKIILLVSHSKEDFEMLCDQILKMEDGRLK